MAFVSLCPPSPQIQAGSPLREGDGGILIVGANAEVQFFIQRCQRLLEVSARGSGSNFNKTRRKDFIILLEPGHQSRRLDFAAHGHLSAFGAAIGFTGGESTAGCLNNWS